MSRDFNGPKQIHVFHVKMILFQGKEVACNHFIIVVIYVDYQNLLGPNLLSLALCLCANGHIILRHEY
jgi:hypothetical protein